MWSNFYFLKPGGSPLLPSVTESEPQDNLSNGHAVRVPVDLHSGGCGGGGELRERGLWQLSVMPLI